MSGTACGTVVLDVSPEAQAGAGAGARGRWSGPATASGFRRAAWQPVDPHYICGYAKLYVDHVQQSHLGADLDFLVAKDTRPVTRESH